jgi:hypothetical protein
MATTLFAVAAKSASGPHSNVARGVRALSHVSTASPTLKSWAVPKGPSLEAHKSDVLSTATGVSIESVWDVEPGLFGEPSKGFHHP